VARVDRKAPEVLAIAAEQRIEGSAWETEVAKGREAGWVGLVEAVRARFKESAMERRRAISAAAAPPAERAAEDSEAVDVLVEAHAAVVVGGADRMDTFFKAPLDEY